LISEGEGIFLIPFLLTDMHGWLWTTSHLRLANLAVAKKSHTESPTCRQNKSWRRPMSTTEIIRDWKSGDQIAWIENDHDVYSVSTKHKFADAARL